MIMASSVTWQCTAHPTHNFAIQKIHHAGDWIMKTPQCVFIQAIEDKEGHTHLTQLSSAHSLLDMTLIWVFPTAYFSGFNWANQKCRPLPVTVQSVLLLEVSTTPRRELQKIKMKTEEAGRWWKKTKVCTLLLWRWTRRVQRAMWSKVCSNHLHGSQVCGFPLWYMRLINKNCSHCTSTSFCPRITARSERSRGAGTHRLWST